MNHHRILAIDFDNTIVIVNQFPSIRRLRTGAKKYINKLHDKGYYIIIWTCRSKDTITSMQEFLDKRGIWYDQINVQHPRQVERWGETRKMSADLYIDDKNLFWFFHPSWFIIYWAVRFHNWIAKEKALKS